MQVVPNGEIYLLKDVPLTNTYEDTLIFINKTEQETYFKAKCPNVSTYSFNQSNYQRISDGVLSIRGVAEEIMKCNYMMFKNAINITENGITTNKSFQWIYAFIVDVKYKSTFCAEIQYEVDVMQTYMVNIDYNLLPAYIDREHSETDAIGDNLIDEGLPVGDYALDKLMETVHTQSGEVVQELFLGSKRTCICVATTFDAQYQPYYGGSWGNCFSGLCLHTWENDQQGILDCATFIANAGAANEGIVAVFLAPRYFVLQMYDLSVGVPKYEHEISMYEFLGDFEGYTPKNNKMYIYPYNYLYVYNGSGNVAEYKLEKFYRETGDPYSIVLDEILDYSCSPCLLLIPKKYEHLPENFTEAITCGPFPQLAYNTDTYRCWLAQNGFSNDVSMLGGIISGISQVFGGVMSAIIPGMDGVNMSTAGANFSIANGLGSIVSGAGSIITSVLQNEANIKHAESLPNQAHGNANSSQVLSTLGELRFHGYRRYARRDYAESIDNFFTMFGYKTNKVKVPNVNVRENYTYTKTVNCQLDNHEMPAVYYDKIISVYNKGVRFWKVPAFIGNYSITNRPLSELT